MIDRYRRVCAGDADLNSIHASWEQSLRRAVEQLPDIEFETTQPGCDPIDSIRNGAFRADAAAPVVAAAEEPVCNSGLRGHPPPAGVAARAQRR